MAEIYFLEFPAPVFRLKIDLDQMEVAVECRFPETESVELYIFKLEPDPEILQSGSLDWSWGLEAIRSGILVLHRVADMNLPFQDGLKFLGLPKFIDLAEIEEGQLSEINEKGFLVSGEKPRLFSLTELQFISPLENQNKPHFSDSPDFYFPRPCLSKQITYLSPEHFPNLKGSIFRVLLKNKEVLAWHEEAESGKYTLWLILAEAGEIKEKLELESEMQKMNPEPFFIARDQILWTAGKDKLCWMVI